MLVLGEIISMICHVTDEICFFPVYNSYVMKFRSDNEKTSNYNCLHSNSTNQTLVIAESWGWYSANQILLIYSVFYMVMLLD